MKPTEKQLSDITNLVDIVIKHADYTPTLLIMVDPDKAGVTIVEVCPCENCRMNNQKIIGMINRGDLKLKFHGNQN